MDGDITVLETPPYEFLQVNGFVYRCNKVTGEMWRLEADTVDKKKQLWARIEERSVGVTH